MSTGYQPATGQPGRYVGSAGDDEINLLFANGSVWGGAGDDRITGSDAADTLDGGAGNDQISGGFGDDTITGGPGRDDLGGDRTAACFYGPIYGTCTIGSGNDTIYAQDGEPDTVDCGPGTDVAFVDAVDTTTGCETLNVAGGPPAGGGAPATGGPPGAGGAPAITTLTGPSLSIGHQHLWRIAKTRAIRLRCALVQAGRCSIRVSITARDARKLRLGVKRHARTFTLGSRTVKLKRAGTATVIVHVPRRTASRLRHARSLRVTLTVTARYATARRTLKRHVRIKR